MKLIYIGLVLQLVPVKQIIYNIEIFKKHQQKKHY